MSDPHRGSGGLLVEVPAETTLIPVIIKPMTLQVEELYAYPQKQADGTWLAMFPQVPAGNWTVEMRYRYDDGPEFSFAEPITVFAGHVAKVILRE